MKKLILSAIVTLFCSTAAMADSLPSSFSGNWVAVKASSAVKSKLLRLICKNPNKFWNDSTDPNGWMAKSKLEYTIYTLNFKNNSFVYDEAQSGAMTAFTYEYTNIKLQTKSNNQIAGTAKVGFNDGDMPENEVSTESFNVQLNGNSVTFNGKQFQRCS